MTLPTMNPGDRVRITVEGEVISVSGFGVNINADGCELSRSELLITKSELTAPTARVEVLPPPIDPDLVLAREVVAQRYVPSQARLIRDGEWDTNEFINIALAAIKASKAGGRV